MGAAYAGQGIGKAGDNMFFNAAASYVVGVGTAAANQMVLTGRGLRGEDWERFLKDQAISSTISFGASLVGNEIRSGLSGGAGGEPGSSEAGVGARGGGAADVGPSADSTSPARPSNEELEAVFGNPVVAFGGEGVPRTQFELTRNLVDQYLKTYSDPWLAWDAVSSARLFDAGFDNPVFRDAEHHLLRYAMASQGERIWSQEGFTKSLALKTEPLRELFGTMGVRSRVEMCGALRAHDLLYYGVRDTVDQIPFMRRHIGETGLSMRVWEDVGYLEGFSSNPIEPMRPFVRGILRYYSGH